MTIHVFQISLAIFIVVTQVLSIWFQDESDRRVADTVKSFYVAMVLIQNL